MFYLQVFWLFEYCDWMKLYYNVMKEVSKFVVIKRQVLFVYIDFVYKFFLFIICIYL